MLSHFIIERTMEALNFNTYYLKLLKSQSISRDIISLGGTSEVVVVSSRDRKIDLMLLRSFG